MPPLRWRLVAATFCWLFLPPQDSCAELAVTRSEDDSTEVYHLTVTPAAEPVPALKHRLTTPPHMLKRGNAPAFYRRVHAENKLQRVQQSLHQQFGHRWSEWVAAGPSLTEVPINDLLLAAQLTGSPVNEYVRPGALCRECDWGLAVEDLTGPESIAFLLPEYQGMRGLGRMTALHTRLAIAKGRYDDAVDYLRMNYRMGRDTGKTPILVCGLVGIAIVGITNNNTLDLIAAPNSPNLYWALGELPDPIIPLRGALRLEMSLGERLFPLLADAETAVHTPAEWNRLWAEMQPTALKVEPMLRTGPAENNGNAFASALMAAPMAIVAYPHAKQRLVDWGYDAKRVEKMPVGQVLAIYSARVYRIHADNFEKLASLPFRDAEPLFEQFEQELAKAMGPLSSHPNREFLPIATTLLPAVRASQRAEARVRREMALLRAIEAVRMHAAETGELPKSLDEITVVPVPQNPVTGEPFQFEVEQANFVFGNEAAHTGSVTFVLPAAEVGHYPERRYEIRLVKPKFIQLVPADETP